jgi:hypothetical protein
MPDLYARFGQIFTQAMRDHLLKTRAVKVPHVGACAFENVQDPEIHNGNWSFTFDLRFPNSGSSMTLGFLTFGSCLMSDAEQLSLPTADFEDPLDKEFPREHQEAWYKLRDALREELLSLGFSDDLNNGDFYLIDDYYPSRGISGSLRRPSLVTPKLAAQCQMLLRRHTGWDFWIQFDLDFRDPRHKGRDEGLLIREDRIVPDLNVSRLKQEFPGEFTWK